MKLTLKFEEYRLALLTFKKKHCGKNRDVPVSEYLCMSHVPYL
jgi:hypothetical protein